MNLYTKGIKRVKYSSQRIYDRFLIFKFRNRPFVEYYAAIANREAKREYLATQTNSWAEEGKPQLAYLIEQGLRPEHILLDIGCGTLRDGVHFITYLEKDNYVGIDISVKVLKYTKDVVTQKGLLSKGPKFQLIKGLSFEEIQGQKFDYVYAHSVLSHMPKEDIDELFKNIHKVLGPNSALYASFFETKKEYHSTVTRRNYHYPRKDLEDLAYKHSLRFERMPGKTDSGKQSLIRISLV
jgi:cyclopropane fatty-acyl-phospholipid synthase-like methyltransferase